MATPIPSGPVDSRIPPKALRALLGPFVRRTEGGTRGEAPFLCDPDLDLDFETHGVNLGDMVGHVRWDVKPIARPER